MTCVTHFLTCNFQGVTWLFFRERMVSVAESMLG
jgi:hypothetical protein